MSRCKRPGCAYPRKPYSGRGRPSDYCATVHCKRARQNERQRASRARRMTLPPRGEALGPGGVEYRGDPERGTAVESDLRIEMRDGWLAPDPVANRRLDKAVDLWLAEDRAGAEKIINEVASRPPEGLVRWRERQEAKVVELQTAYDAFWRDVPADVKDQVDQLLIEEAA